MKYTAAGLASLGLSACEGTVFDRTYNGEGSISDISYENGKQIIEVGIRRSKGDSLVPPSYVIQPPVEREVPIQVSLASQKPIKAKSGDRLKFKYKLDNNKNDFERSISGWTKPSWCQVYQERVKK